MLFGRQGTTGLRIAALRLSSATPGRPTSPRKTSAFPGCCISLLPEDPSGHERHTFRYPDTAGTWSHPGPGRRLVTAAHSQLEAAGSSRDDHAFPNSCPADLPAKPWSALKHRLRSTTERSLAGRAVSPEAR